jgi:hypothetical protein
MRAACEAPFRYRSAADEGSFLQALAAAAAAATGQGFAATASGGSVVLSSPSAFAVFSGDPSVAMWAEAPGEAPRFSSRRLGDGYGADSVARALGLSRGKTVAVAGASGGFEVVAPHLHKLNEPVTAYIRIGDSDAFEVPSAGISTGAGGCLAIVDARPRGGGQPDASPVEKAYHPPLGKLQRISISVVDYFGRPLETDNVETRFDLTVRTAPANAGAPAIAGAPGGFGINNAPREALYGAGDDVPLPLAAARRELALPPGRWRERVRARVRRTQTTGFPAAACTKAGRGSRRA